MTPEALMARHARSFAPAARLLARPDRRRVARLYALCRTVDDIADDIGGAVGHARLQRLHDQIGLPVPTDTLAQEAQHLFAGRPAGLRAFGDLVAAAAADVGPTCIADDATLDDYCMGVAGTVGVMMCALFDIPDRWHGAAADLGKAMQLTNICRDVAEDARAGRRYLPHTRCPFAPEAIADGSPDAIAAASKTMADLLDRADVLYHSGHAGLVALPIRLRLAVAVAASIYAGIGARLRQRNFAPLQGRAIVPARHKIRLAIMALLGESMRSLHVRELAPDVGA
jgi:phytoene synthase